jgi:hypothetical protein
MNGYKASQLVVQGFTLTTLWANTIQEDCTGQAGVYSQDPVTFSYFCLVTDSFSTALY